MDNVYNEDFVKTINPDAFGYVMSQIREVHTQEEGWVVGEPKVISKNPDGTITISVPLTKYPVEKGFRRSI